MTRQKIHMATVLRRRLALLFLCLVVSACAGRGFDTLDGFTPAAVRTTTDFEAIAIYAQYAQAAYLPEAEIKTLYPGTVRINAPKGTKTRYFLDVQPTQKLQTISVRGTKTLNDVLHDVEFAIVAGTGLPIPIHKGFEADALLIYADVKPYLRKDYRTRLTGHSLGAAVSAILMIYLQRDGFQVEPSINFGQPKFTNVAGAEHYKDLPLQRVVDRNDVVPMLPPPLVKHPRHGAYAHLGEEIVLLDGPYFVRLDEHDSERLSVDEYWRDRRFASKADHRMAVYRDRIDSKRKVARQLSYDEWKRDDTPAEQARQRPTLSAVK